MFRYETRGLSTWYIPTSFLEIQVYSQEGEEMGPRTPESGPELPFRGLRVGRYRSPPEDLRTLGDIRDLHVIRILFP